MNNEPTLSINRIADYANISHNTARRRLISGNARPDDAGRYTFRSILAAWESIAGGRSGELDATEAKTKLANLKIEEQTLLLRQAKLELIERGPYEQFINTLVKCAWSTIQSQGFTLDQLNHIRNEFNRVIREFIEQNTGVEILTLAEQEDELASKGEK